MKNIIGIIGAGRVGAEVANALLRMNIGDCVLIDRDESSAIGKSLDLAHSSPMQFSSATVKGGNDFALLRGAGIVVIAAGEPRKPGMSRDDLLENNFRMVEQVVPSIMTHAPNAIIIVVTNPLDAMTYAVWKMTGKPRNQVIGMAGALDSARFAAHIALETGISAENVHALVLGSHGDLMIPLTRYATVAGIRIEELLDQGSIRRIVERTKSAGTELVTLLKNGSAYFAAGMAIATMIDSIIKNKRKIICSSVLCEGEYGIKNLFIGVPIILGSRGLEEIVTLKLMKEEHAALLIAANHLEATQKMVDRHFAF